MKKNKIFSLLAGGLALGFVACNDSSDNTGANGDSTNANNMAGTATSSGNYAARADSIRANVAAGYYLNPRTGKKYSNLNLDQNTGALTDESGKPVRRYVDSRTWWVYDANSWDTVGSAQMQNERLMYRGENGDWLDYDKRWSDDMDNMDNGNTTSGDTTTNTSGTTGNSKVSDNGNKVKENGTKVKVSDKGDKIKIKKTDGKQ